MDKSDVKEYHARRGIAEVIFNDGSQLNLIPYRNWGNVEGFDSALIYQAGCLEALATQRPSRYSKPEERGFFSKGKITQQQLAEYLDVASEIGNQVYHDYDTGKIDKNSWDQQFYDFWTITGEIWILKKSLKEGKEKVFEKKPNRFKDKI